MIKEIRFRLNADEAPSLSGAYAMAIELTDKAAVMLSGRLPIALPAGRYLYCGSAKGWGGLKARLSRHKTTRMFSNYRTVPRTIIRNINKAICFNRKLCRLLAEVYKRSNLALVASVYQPTA